MIFSHHGEVKLVIIVFEGKDFPFFLEWVDILNLGTKQHITINVQENE